MIKRVARLLIAQCLVIAGILSGDTLAAYAQEKSLAVNGVTLSYVDEGAGEPVVLVHGALSDRRVWSAQIPALAKEFRVIAYTQRYYGAAPWPDQGENFSHETMAKDLVAFVKALDVGPVHMVTWSNGGSIGTIAEVMAPELFLSVVHYEPVWAQFLATSDEGQAAFAEIEEALGPAFEAIGAGDLSLGVERFVNAVWERSDGFSTLETDAQAALLDQKRTLTLEAGELPPVTCEMLGQLEIPTLVVLGEDTRLKFFTMATKAMANCLGNANLAMMPNATHGGPVLNSEAFNAKVIEFLRAQ